MLALDVGDGQAIVRALGGDGAEKWRAAVALDSAESVAKLIGSPTGGALLVTTESLVRVAAPGAGSGWRAAIRQARRPSRKAAWSGSRSGRRHGGRHRVAHRLRHRGRRAGRRHRGAAMAARGGAARHRPPAQYDSFVDFNVISEGPADVSAPVVDEHGVVDPTVDARSTSSELPGGRPRVFGLAASGTLDPRRSRRTAARPTRRCTATTSPARLGDPLPAYVSAVGASLAPQSGGGVAVLERDETVSGNAVVADAGVLRTVGPITSAPSISATSTRMARC